MGQTAAEEFLGQRSFLLPWVCLTLLFVLNIQALSQSKPFFGAVAGAITIIGTFFGMLGCFESAVFAWSSRNDNRLVKRCVCSAVLSILPIFIILYLRR
jgi:hypothetical protein